jgi:hypothetical protein
LHLYIFALTRQTLQSLDDQKPDRSHRVNKPTMRRVEGGAHWRRLRFDGGRARASLAALKSREISLRHGV